MLKIGLWIALAAAGMGGLLLAFREGSKERDREARSEAVAASAPRARRNAAGEVELRLDRETQARLGLRVEPLQSARLSPEIQAYGRVLDPAPLLALYSELSVAQTSLVADRAELERLRTLAGQGNASLRAAQTAAAAARRDEIQISTLKEKFLLTYGGAIARRPDQEALIHALDTRAQALARVDLPPGARLSTGGPPGEESERWARLASLTQDTPLAARWLGPAPDMDARTQGRGTLWLVETNAGRLVPGEAVTAYLPEPGEPRRGLLVPRAAVVRFEGASWYYAQTGEETFARMPIRLEQPMEDGWFIPGGAEPGRGVVVTGAQVLLSEEFKQQIIMPD